MKDSDWKLEVVVWLNQTHTVALGSTRDGDHRWRQGVATQREFVETIELKVNSTIEPKDIQQLKQELKRGNPNKWV